VLVLSLIWAAIICKLCRSGQHSMSWFLLLLPIAVIFLWYISLALARASTCPSCVGGTDESKNHI
jgi:hypothetical protein